MKISPDPRVAIGYAIRASIMTLLIAWLLPHAFIGGQYLAMEGKIDYEKARIVHSKMRLGLLVMFPLLLSLSFIGTWFFSRKYQWELSADGLVVTKSGSEQERHELTAVLVKERQQRLRILEAGRSVLSPPVLHSLPFVSEDRKVAFIREFQRLRDEQTEQAGADQPATAPESNAE